MFTHAIFGKSGDTPTPEPSTTYGEVQVLLWENPKPTSGFTPQTVTLNLTEYNGVIVEFGRSDANIVTRVKANKNESEPFGAGVYYDGSKTRNFNVTDSGVTFKSGYSDSSSDNTFIIPTKIYGYRKYSEMDITGILENCVYAAGGTEGTVPTGFKKSYFVPYRVSGKYSAKINGTEVMADNDSTTFQVFEVNANDTFVTEGSTGQRMSILVQLN